MRVKTLPNAIVIPRVSAIRYLPRRKPTEGQYAPAQTWTRRRETKEIRDDEIIDDRKKATEEAARRIWKSESGEI